MKTRSSYRFYYIVIIAFLALPILSNAECTITYKGDAQSVLTPDLTHWSIQNNAFEEGNVYLVEEINTLTGIKILTDQSRQFPLSVGITDVSPASNGIPQFSNNEAQIAYTQTGRLPFNNYSICVTLYEVGTGKLLGTACKTIYAELTPPQLISPFNQDHIPPVQPMFTWLRPQSVEAGMQDIDYTLVITEVLPGQSGIEAINSNPYFLEQERLRTENYLYPPSGKELVAGNLYAWQITAYSSGQMIGKTEVWTFTPDSIAKKVKPQVIPQASFTELKQRMDAGYITCVNKVRFKLKSYEQVIPTQIVIFDEMGQDVTPGALAFAATYTDQRYEIDLSPYKQFKDEWSAENGFPIFKKKRKKVISSRVPNKI